MDKMNKQSDSILIDQVLNGNVNAFARLISQNKDMVFTIAFRLLKNREDAEEITQDTFIKAYQKLSEFKRQSAFSTWLYSIVYRTSISRLRKKKLLYTDMEENQQLINTSFFSKNAYDEITDQEQKTLIQKIILSLPEEDQFLIQQFYSEELSLEELSEMMGTTKNNLKVRLFRIRKKLQEIISHKYYNEFFE